MADDQARQELQAVLERLRATLSTRSPWLVGIALRLTIREALLLEAALGVLLEHAAAAESKQ